MRPALSIGMVQHSMPPTSKPIGVLQEHAKKRPRQKKGGRNRRVVGSFARWHYQQNPPLRRRARFALVDPRHGRAMQRCGPDRTRARRHQRAPFRPRTPSQKADLSACGSCLWRTALPRANSATRHKMCLPRASGRTKKPAT